MRVLAVVLLSLGLLQAKAQLTVAIGAQKEQVYPLLPNAIDTLEDVAPVCRLFGGKGVVCMGEATHGTKEFFNLKAKVFKQLVLEHGFRTFILEASFGECASINLMLNDPDIPIDHAVKRFSFWTWQTAEVLQLLTWIRAYNATKPSTEKLRFMGCDMQHPHTAIRFIDKTLARTFPDSVPEWNHIIAPLRVKKWKDLPSEKKQKAINEELLSWLAAHDTMLVRVLDPELLWTVRMCERIAHQGLVEVEATYRDSCMAANVLAIDSLRDGGLFVWAHNAHVRRVRGQWKDAGDPMGAWLQRACGDDLFVLGFAFHEGCFIANDKRGDAAADAVKKRSVCCVLDAPHRSPTGAMADTNLPAFLIDLRKSANEVLLEEREVWEVGAAFFGEEHHLRRRGLAADFSALIFVRRSTPTVPLAR